MIKICNDEELNREYTMKILRATLYFEKKLVNLTEKYDSKMISVQKKRKNPTRISQKDNVHSKVHLNTERNEYLKSFRSVWCDPKRLTMDGEIDLQSYPPKKMQVVDKDLTWFREWDAKDDKKLKNGLLEFGLYGIPDIICNYFPNHDPEMIYPHVYRILGAKPNGSNADAKYKSWCKRKDADYYKGWEDIESNAYRKTIDKYDCDPTKWKTHRWEKRLRFTQKNDFNGMIEIPPQEVSIEKYCLEKYRKKTVKVKKNKNGSYVRRHREPKVKCWDFDEDDTDDEKEDEHEGEWT